jgi:hypothetical protein
MSIELWHTFETDQFRKDVLHFEARESLVETWRGNLRRNPMIGEPVQGSTGIGGYDYHVGSFIIRYILVPQDRHILLMMLRPPKDDSPALRERLSKSRRLLVDIIGIWSGIRPS